ncbi:MAG: transcriptional repressor [Microthrixaceae bacterium]|nr:transcriptional repressor [Acidimicrobiales bacterium]MCB9403247.1 transcriptional repressor [Microthrixaceae bacterium]
MSDDLHGAIGELLGDDGQRYTTGRRNLVEVLRRASRPLTAAEILAAGSLPLSSAYRNLAVLEACGVVHRVAGTDELARFELAEDLTDHHHHLICTECGTVLDFTVPDALEADLAAVTAEVASATGFRTRHHRLDLLGRCADCD